jgi:GTP:adenosylcobinamide-phosphate guanylyltransferase
MDAVVTAGGIPPSNDPLYQYSQGRSKALVEVGGRPMIQWVLDALAGAPRVERVAVVGLDEASGVTGGGKALGFVPAQGDMIPNIQAGVRWVASQNPQATHVLLVSSDIPAITTEMVDWVLDAAEDGDYDLYYTVVEKEVMERRFPGSKRSYITTSDAVVCGADLNVVGVRAVLDVAHQSLWEKVVEARKNAFKQAQLVGFDILLRLLTRRISLGYAEANISQRLGIRGRILRCPFAEVGMDVDKPWQLELIRQDMAQRAVAA